MQPTKELLQASRYTESRDSEMDSARGSPLLASRPFSRRRFAGLCASQDKTAHLLGAFYEAVQPTTCAGVAQFSNPVWFFYRFHHMACEGG